MPQLQNAHINVKEAVASLLAIYHWAPWLTNSNVIIHSDNRTTAAILNKGSCHNEFLMYYLRGLFWMCKGLNMSVKCSYIRGSDNYIADSVSRLHERGHILHWYSLISRGQPFCVQHLAALCLGNMSPTSALSLLQARPWDKR